MFATVFVKYVRQFVFCYVDIQEFQSGTDCTGLYNISEEIYSLGACIDATDITLKAKNKSGTVRKNDSGITL